MVSLFDIGLRFATYAPLTMYSRLKVSRRSTTDCEVTVSFTVALFVLGCKKGEKRDIEAEETHPNGSSWRSNSPYKAR